MDVDRPSGRVWGGPWTDARLNALGNYLKAYVTALSGQRFALIYIDAFAGAGQYRRPGSGASEGDPEIDDELFRRGSPRRALEVGGFGRYVFIEKSSRNTRLLEQLRRDYPDRRITVLRGDANRSVPELLSAIDWDGPNRGVIYFDPFGLQLRWATLEAVAKTKLDVWLLFPIGAANRLLKRDGQIDRRWANALDRLLGSEDWRRVMYLDYGDQLAIDGEPKRIRTKQAWTALLAHVKVRLQALFGERNVSEPAIQKNSRGAPLFAVFFAVANPSPTAVSLARKLADYVLGDLAGPQDLEW